MATSEDSLKKTPAKPFVFVSYARGDSTFVDRLKSDLERDGFHVWRDRERIQGGDSIPAEIADAIKGADFFLVVVSRSSNKSRWVKNELNKAVMWETDSRRPKTIPIRRGNSRIPAIVGERQYVPFGLASYKDSYAALLGALRGQPLAAVRSSRKAAVLAVAAALLLAGLSLWFYLKPPAGIPTIVVRSFENTARRPDDAWVSTALGDMLAAALRAGGGARVVDREEVSRSERDFLLAGKTPSPADFRRRLGVDYVVSGAFEWLPESSALAISCRVADTTGRGDSPPSGSTGALSTLPDLVAGLAAWVGKRIRLPPLSYTQKAELQALFPGAPKGLELYFAGVASHRSFDPSTAYLRLDAARAVEPDQPLIYRRLASVAWDLRREEDAKGFATRAQQLAGNLPRRERLEIELLEPKMSGTWGKVIPRYEELQRLAPKESSYRLELAGAHESAGDSAKALDILNALLAEGPPLYVQAAALYKQADIQDDLGQPKEALDLVDRAVEKAKASEAAYRLAEAQLLRSHILHRLGKYASAMSDLDAALGTFSQAGAKSSVLACEEERAILQIYLASSPLPAILKDLQRLEKKYPENAHEERARVLVLESMVLSDQGQSAEAAKRSKVAEDVLGNESQDVLVSILGEQAFALILRGDTEGARKKADEALAVPTGERSSRTSTALTNLAENFYYRGMLEDARKYQERALENRSGSHEAYGQFRLGMIRAAQGEAEGRRNVEKAYEMQEQIPADRAETALGLARLDSLAGNFSEAAELAENAEVVLNRTGRSDLVALAQAARGWALTCEGDTVTAGKALAAAKKRSGDSEDFRVHFETAISAARFQALSHQKGVDAIHVLEEIVKEAHERGYRLYELDARLALGEVKLALGTGGREELMRLETDAAQSGFHQIEKLAARALKKGPVCSGRPLTLRDHLSHWLSHRLR